MPGSLLLSRHHYCGVHHTYVCIAADIKWPTLWYLGTAPRLVTWMEKDDMWANFSFQPKKRRVKKKEFTQDLTVQRFSHTKLLRIPKYTVNVPRISAATTASSHSFKQAPSSLSPKFNFHTSLWRHVFSSAKCFCIKTSTSMEALALCVRTPLFPDFSQKVTLMQTIQFNTNSCSRPSVVHNQCWYPACP